MGQWLSTVRGILWPRLLRFPRLLRDVTGPLWNTAGLRLTGAVNPNGFPSVGGDHGGFSMAGGDHGGFPMAGNGLPTVVGLGGGGVPRRLEAHGGRAIA